MSIFKEILYYYYVIIYYYNIILPTVKFIRQLLGRHEHDEWMAEIPRYILKGKTIIGINNNEQWFPSERIKISWI